MLVVLVPNFMELYQKIYYVKELVWDCSGLTMANVFRLV